MPRLRQLAAIMFTDIEGYTALMQQNEAQAIQVRSKHRDIFNAITNKHRGKILQYFGDGTLSIFQSAVDAVHCGIDMQMGFMEDPAIPVRIGIHTGDIILNDDEIIGDSVNVAARLESLAVAGSILISGKVYDEIKNQEAIRATYMNTFQLKNIQQPVQVYAVANEGLIVPEPKEIKGHTSSSSGQAQTTTSEIPSTASIPSLLSTKLYIPPPRSKMVYRSRLIVMMEASVQHKLTLISAQAGFGKTTLVSAWISQSERKVAWLSLDEGDNDPNRFLIHLIAALQKVASGIGEGITRTIQSPQPPTITGAIGTLINEMQTISDGFSLVLDDYHVIENRSVNDALVLLLDHQPPQMHLIITTREDPNLPLPRLRVRNQLTEIRIKDLRFTPSETAEFINEIMGLKLSENDIRTLEIQTEGWAAGLQLAALSMQGRDDLPAFIRTFAGHDRYILDYLVEEVLQRQTQRIKDFLLETSMLNRLCSPLCDAVTGENDAAMMLDELDRSNLFILPLDDKREWYRYHRLFADVLQTILEREKPDQVKVLHRRASDWFEQNDMRAESIHHALASQDFDRAAALTELAWPEMDRNYLFATWLVWAKALPEETVRRRPVLSASYAWALLDTGDLEGAEGRLKDVEGWLETEEANDGTTTGDMIVTDEEQFRSLPGSIATARAYIAQSLGNISDTVMYARRALELYPTDDFIRRGTPTILLGFAAWINGELETACQSITSAMDNFRKAGNWLFTISGTFLMADIRITQGQLRAARSILDKSLELSETHGKSVLQGTADIHLGLCKILQEQQKLEEATKHLNISKKLFERFSYSKFRLHVVQARMEMIKGNPIKALTLLEEAEQQYIMGPLPDLRPIAAMRARCWLRMNRLDDAINWIEEANISTEDDLSFLHEYEHITLTRILLTQYTLEKQGPIIEKATHLLSRLREAAEQGGRIGSVIEILILQALSLQARDETQLALAAIERALTLAAPEGYIRMFIDEGTPILPLLKKAAKGHAESNYIQTLVKFLTA